MADQIPPPTASAPLTAADAAIIRAEKQLDENTRGRLVQVYGESKRAQGRHIALRRPPRQAWKCRACNQMSDDIRKVCGNCLMPEPGAGAGARPLDKRNVVELRPGKCGDAHTHIRVIAATGRSYRQFTDDGAHTTATTTSTAAAGGGPTSSTPDGEDGMYDDEPECGDDDGAAAAATAGRTTDEHEDNEGEGEEEEGQVPPPAALPPASTHNKERHLPPERGSPFTHFVALPVGTLEAVRASAEGLLAPLRTYVAGVFAAEEAARKATQGGDSAKPPPPAAATHLSPDLVSPTGKLHMTLLLLALPSPADVAFAKELLRVFGGRWAAEAKRQLPPASRGTTGIEVRLRGLHVMPDRDSGRPTPKKASVVYLGLQDGESARAVQSLQTLLHECFAELISDVIRAEVERTKQNLHVTVMNQKWRRSKGAKRPFDATSVLAKFGEAGVAGTDARAAGGGGGAVHVPRLDLCRMGGPNGKDGAYFVEDSIAL